MIVGTRGSDLAKTQTAIIADKISRKLGIEVGQEIIKTRGDMITDRPLRELEGRGYFTKEIEEALLDKRIDIAVHSFKDMPSQAPEGLVLAAVSEREDPADLLIINRPAYIQSAGDIPLGKGAIVGTSAVRRETQLRAMRDDLIINDLRGNVPTRLKKLKEGHYDAIFLAGAGVNRLKVDLSEFIVCRLEPIVFVPSPGQGVLAIQMRKDDSRIKAIRGTIHDKDAGIATTIERDVMARFGGGCSLPLGVYAFEEAGFWHAYGFWGGGKSPVWRSVKADDHRQIGEKLFKALRGES